MTAQTIGNLYGQMNPEVIGSERRSLLIAKKYGHLLTEGTENARNSHTVDHFVSCYPSHDFVIDDEEARKWFKNVELPSEELYDLLALLGAVAREEAHQTVVLRLSPQTENQDEHDDENNAADAELQSSEDQIDEGRSANDVPSGRATADSGGASPLDEGGGGDRESDAEPSNRIDTSPPAESFQNMRPN
jgi:hypothetical protein